MMLPLLLLDAITPLLLTAHSSTTVATVLSLPLPLPLVDCFIGCCWHCCCIFDNFAVAVVAILPVTLPLLGCHHLLCAIVLILLSCGCSKPLQMLLPLLTFAAACYTMVPKNSHCSCHLLFLLPSLMLLVHMSSLFLFFCCSCTVLPMPQSVLSCCPLFLLAVLQWYTFVLSPQSLLVDCYFCKACHCGCCAVVTVAAAVLLQMQQSQCTDNAVSCPHTGCLFAVPPL